MPEVDREIRVGPLQWNLLVALEKRQGWAIKAGALMRAVGATWSEDQYRHALHSLARRRYVRHACLGHPGPIGVDCMVEITEPGSRARLRGGYGRYRAAWILAAARRTLRAPG